MLSQIFGDKSVLLWGHGDKAPSLGTVPEVWGQLAPMLAPNRKHFGKALARNSRSVMAAEMLKMPSTQKYVIDKVGILLRKELMGLCSYNNQSVLQIPLEDFTWKFFIDKLSKYAHILY